MTVYKQVKKNNPLKKHLSDLTEELSLACVTKTEVNTLN